jgi:hypothetical protein
MIDIISAIGYLSGITFIQPHLEPATFIRTVSVIHLMNAVLCYVVATQSGRNRTIWTLAGLVLGVWAVGTLFILVERGSDNQANSGG